MKPRHIGCPVASNPGLSYTQKISLAAASLSALYLLPAQAGIVYVNTPLSLAINVPEGTTVSWDVDGVNGPEFQLFKSVAKPPFFPTGELSLNSATVSSAPLNGQGWVVPNPNDPNIPPQAVQALQKSFIVGPTLAAYAWGAFPTNNRTILLNKSNKSIIGASFANYGFQAGDNYAGFRFQGSAGTLYGWALINFDLTQGQSIVTIKEWAYNDTPDGPIHIADTASAIPEPSTPALTLLGLGAAGLRAWRARKRTYRVPI